MIVNALTYAVPDAKCDRFNLVNLTSDNGAYKLLNAQYSDVNYKRLYLSDIRAGDNIIDDVTRRVLEGKSELIVRAASDLDEVGYFDARCSLSPIMLLHKLGLLECVRAVVGGVYLDRDDVDLMVQCGCPLILTPSYDMGKGHGIADAVMYVKRGLKIGLGSEDCSYNESGDACAEARLLRLCMNALMHDENALSDSQLNEMLNFSLRS